MTVYLDSSALVKALLRESGARVVQSTVAADPLVWVCTVSYVEVRAGIARAVREQRLAATDLAHAVAELDAVWPTYSELAVDADLVRQAASLVDRHTRHALRAFDALQLAAALLVAGGAPQRLTFVCWDRRLWRSARDEGLACIPRSQP